MAIVHGPEEGEKKTKDRHTCEGKAKQLSGKGLVAVVYLQIWPVELLWYRDLPQGQPGCLLLTHNDHLPTFSPGQLRPLEAGA